MLSQLMWMVQKHRCMACEVLCHLVQKHRCMVCEVLCEGWRNADGKDPAMADAEPKTPAVQEGKKCSKREGSGPHP